MTIRWLLLQAASLPVDDDWLGAEEQRVLAGLKLAKRRSEWRLGRYTAKCALASAFGVERLNRLQVIAAEDGAPEPRLDGVPLHSSMSISHRDEVAVCTLASGMRVGCDLEAIEPRTRRFVVDYFTEREVRAVDATPAELRDRQVALTWSAKESALKVLRVGLRRDTRSVDVQLGATPTAEGWHLLGTTVRPEERTFRGWWRQEADLVLTVVCDDADATPPVALSLARHDEQR